MTGGGGQGALNHGAVGHSPSPSDGTAFSLHTGRDPFLLHC